MEETSNQYESRLNWAKKSTGEYPGDIPIIAGSVQRIATATERISKMHEEIMKRKPVVYNDRLLIEAIKNIASTTDRLRLAAYIIKDERVVQEKAKIKAINGLATTIGIVGGAIIALLGVIVWGLLYS